jgi:TolB protein
VPTFIRPRGAARSAIVSLAVLAAALVAVGSATVEEPAAAREPTSALIGYTELQTDLPGGRHANVATMRACVCRADGTDRRLLAEDLAGDADTWTQFAGWSPDGHMAIVLRGWESPDNASWEEEHRQFRFTADGWLVDTYLVDIETGERRNVTAVERVSFYNAGLFYWPGDAGRLGFTALIDGESRPFSMDLDGANKVDLSTSAPGFSYGFGASPDGTHIAYHKDYQVYIAAADGTQATRIDTGRPFNFAPQWSPDSQWLVFLAGEHYDCHPHVVRRDGTGLRQIADRGGYRGIVEFLDVDDFHGGSSDTSAWSADGWIYYTAQVGESVELMRVSLEHAPEQLTRSRLVTWHYHPQPSPDGTHLAYGSRRDGVRDLYVRDTARGREWKLTELARGRAAMWPHWQAEGGAE